MSIPSRRIGTWEFLRNLRERERAGKGPDLEG